MLEVRPGSDVRIFDGSEELGRFTCHGSAWSTTMYGYDPAYPMRFRAIVLTDPWIRGFHFIPSGEERAGLWDPDRSGKGQPIVLGKSSDDGKDDFDPLKPSAIDLFFYRHDGAQSFYLDPGISYPDPSKIRRGYIHHMNWVCVAEPNVDGSRCYKADFLPNSKPSSTALVDLYAAPDASWGIGVKEHLSEVPNPFGEPGYIALNRPPGTDLVPFRLEAAVPLPALLITGFAFLKVHGVYVVSALDKPTTPDSNQTLYVVWRDGTVETIGRLSELEGSLKAGPLGEDAVYFAGRNVSLFHFPSRRLTLVDRDQEALQVGSTTLLYRTHAEGDQSDPPPQPSPESPSPERSTWVRPNGEGGYERLSNEWAAPGTSEVLLGDTRYATLPLERSGHPDGVDSGARWGLWRTLAGADSKLLAVTPRQLTLASDGAGLLATDVGKQLIYELALPGSAVPVLRGPMMRGRLPSSTEYRCGDCAEMAYEVPRKNGVRESRFDVAEDFRWWPLDLMRRDYWILVCRFPPRETLGKPPIPKWPKGYVGNP